jgi:hypothetical protein
MRLLPCYRRWKAADRILGMTKARTLGVEKTFRLWCREESTPLLHTGRHRSSRDLNGSTPKVTPVFVKFITLSWPDRSAAIRAGLHHWDRRF